MTVAITIGEVRGGGPAVMDLAELLSTRLLVQGNSGSGKSHLLRRLLEQSATLVQQAIIDPEGDFVSLAEKYGHLVIDGAMHTEAELQAAGERMRVHRASVVLNLEGVDAELQMRRAAAFLGGMFEVARAHWYPVLVVVDEAQLFAPAAAGEVSDEARRASLGAMTNLMCRGRKRGLAGVIATQRLAKLAKNVAAEASNFLMGRTFLDIDMARAADLLGMERRQAESFRDLQRGFFVALGPALCRRPVAVRIGEVETESRSAGPTLMPFEPAPPPEEMRELILTPLPDRELMARPARTPAPPPPDILAQLAAHAASAAVEAEAEEPPPQTPADRVEQRRRFAAILTDILRDEDAGFRPVHVLYQDFLVRCRIEGMGRQAMDMPQFRRALATARAGIDAETAEGEAWQQAERIATPLPDDMRGIFLLIARAAMEGAPCPSDATIARAYGTHSLGRARRQLAYLEEQNVIVLRTDGMGRRSAAVIGLGWETAPSDPNGAGQSTV
ncbi:ATP-binding protein [Gluconacetobacter azotocaptans]|uniref:ATP-binding protein n=1 Tax=Gluconacetobacter azotocaptans TaxID=142834 RepID=UPI00195900D6|nr:ATP-binding protein [Gluconacetobacter azotocaptans]MBM9403588.1 ATP-binding protein [Gluconacetobacter azotocaptans]